MDFSRIARVRLVEQVALPATPRDTSPASCKAALVAIDGLCGKRSNWTCTIEEIAQRMHVCYSTAKRALRQLRRWELLIVTRNKCPGRGYRRSTYQVCWSNLKAAREEPETYFAATDSSPAHVRWADASERETSAGAPPNVRLDGDANAAFFDAAMGHCAPSDGAQCPERWGTVPHLINSPLVLPQENSPSSSSSLGAASEGSRPSNSRSPDWEEAEGELRRELGDWRRPLAACREAVEPAYVLAAIAHYRRAGPRVYGPGALFFRLVNVHRDVPPESAWAPPTPPTPRVRRGLDELVGSRRYVGEKQIEMSEAEFWAAFARRLERLQLGDVLAEVRFRDALAHRARQSNAAAFG